jgi:hypothetical protein
MFTDHERWCHQQNLDVGYVTRNEKSKTNQTPVELRVLADKLLIQPLQNVLINEPERLRNKIQDYVCEILAICL